MGKHVSSQTVQSSSRPWFYLETDQPHGTSIIWNQSHGPPGAAKPQVSVQYIGTAGAHVPTFESRFVSFRVHEMLIGTSDPERYALSKQQMAKRLAPQTLENPLYFHVTTMETSDVKHLIDQMADVGLEMLVYSFHSGFDYLRTDAKFMQQITHQVQYAKSKGIEVGGYLNMSSHQKMPTKWRVIDPGTFQPSPEACLASQWMDFLIYNLDTLMNVTGMSMILADGSYDGYSCASNNHIHHKGLSDSILRQTTMQSQLLHNMRRRGVYIEINDWYIYQGANRAGE